MVSLWVFFTSSRGDIFLNAWLSLFFFWSHRELHTRCFQPVGFSFPFNIPRSEERRKTAQTPVSLTDDFKAVEEKKVCAWLHLFFFFFQIWLLWQCLLPRLHGLPVALPWPRGSAGQPRGQAAPVVNHGTPLVNEEGRPPFDSIVLWLWYDIPFVSLVSLHRYLNALFLSSPLCYSCICIFDCRVCKWMNE